MDRNRGSGSAVRIYTKSGDDGFTGLLGSGRVPKDDLRVEAYGTVDELNAALGVARADGLDPRADGLVALLQDELFVVGSALADPALDGPFHAAVTPRHVERLELAIDVMEEELKPLTQFILPGGSRPAAQLHLARTICRRAERLVVALSRQPGQDVPRDLIVYLNRLSDLLFVLARAVNHRAGVSDVHWKGI
jgi:cob(I)alamin adenosyltransferase